MAAGGYEDRAARGALERGAGNPMSDGAVLISAVDTAVYTVPTPEPEADGTLSWDATTAVVVTLHAGGRTGLGWTYSSAAAATVVHDELIDAVRGCDAFDIAAGW